MLRRPELRATLVDRLAITVHSVALYITAHLQPLHLYPPNGSSRHPLLNTHCVVSTLEI